jgi:hypothetical protein
MTAEPQWWDLNPQRLLRAECNRCHRFVAECWRHGDHESIEEYRWDTHGAKCDCSPRPVLPEGDALQQQLVRRTRMGVEVLKVRVR